MTASFVVAIFAVIILASLLAAPRRVAVDGFFGGQSYTGQAPKLLTLV